VTDDFDARLDELRHDLDSRWPESKLEPTLDRVRAVLHLLADPERAYPVIHVGGTNGKTSTARMIDAVLQAFGLHTGRFTSPHLSDMRERITLDGEPIDVERFVEAFEDVFPYVELIDSRNAENDEPRLSYFEMLTVIGLAAFADAPVDVAVVEVGMGGTWDATNVVDSVVSVITPIGLDHQGYLGHTVEAIAGEKAGIIKPGGAVVLAQQPQSVAAEVVINQAAQLEAVVSREGLEFGVLSREVALGGQLLSIQGLGGVYEEVFLPLHGAHQAHNAACALVAVETFLGGGRGLLDIEAVRAGFAAVRAPGRLEPVRRGPTVLLDVAHNPAGAASLAAALAEEFAFDRLVAVIGMLSDKDAAGFLEALEPVVESVVLTTPDSPRAFDLDALEEIAVDVFGEDRVSRSADLVSALDEALAAAEQDGPAGGAGVLVTGSVVTVGQARAVLRRDASGDPVGD
jgi:dihydrofolate synthase / folylpolyglutamate synthase